MIAFIRSMGRPIREGIYIRTALVVFLVACAARLLVLLRLVLTQGSDVLVFGDTQHYLALADSVLAGQGYMYDGIFETFRLPGYPAYLMLLRILHLPLVWGSVIQILFASGIAAWIVWFARIRLGLSERASLIVGLLAALEPIQVYYSVILLPDVFFTVAFVVAFTYTLRWMDSYRVLDAVIIGLAIGIGNYIRPVMIYFPFFIAAAFILVVLVRKTDVRRALIASAIIGAISFAIMSPWYIRNKAVFGYFSLMSMKEYTLYVYGAASIDAAVRGVPYETSKQELLAKARAEAPDPNIATFANGPYYREKSKEIILAHPVVFLKLYSLGLTSFWTAGNYQYLFKSMGLLAPPSQSISYTMLLGSEGPVVAIQTFFSKITEPFIMVALFDRVFWASIFFISLLGIYAYRRDNAGWFTLVVYAYFSATILSTVIGVEARHRDALNPIIFAFAVAGVVAAYRRISRTIRST